MRWLKAQGGQGLLLLGVILCCWLTGCQPKIYESPMPLPPPKAQPPPPVAVSRPVFYVGANRLNLRAGPGMDFPKISLLERNEVVEKVGESEDWAQVRVRRDGRLGWVNLRYLSENPVPITPEAPPVPPPTTVTPPVMPPPLPEVTPPEKPPVAEKAKPAKPPEAATPAPKKKAEETWPAKPAKPAEAAETTPRKRAPGTEQPAPPAEKAKPPAEKPAPPEEPAPEQQKRIRIM